MRRRRRRARRGKKKKGRRKEEERDNKEETTIMNKNISYSKTENMAIKREKKEEAKAAEVEKVE